MLVELLRNKPWLRRVLSGLSVLLVLGGLALVGYPFATNMWTDRIQERLEDQIASPELQQAYKERKIETGDSLTRIKIPALGLDTVVVEGITPSALRAGAGHAPQPPRPCEGGNVSLAGHRTTDGRPFGNVDQLKPGDTIELTTPIGGCVYQVAKAPYVVAPSEMSVIDPTAERSLTLTTCHPKGSAAQRLIIRATWVRDLKAA